jgi:hypothetical protein
MIIRCLRLLFYLLIYLCFCVILCRLLLVLSILVPLLINGGISILSMKNETVGISLFGKKKLLTYLIFLQAMAM